MKSLALALVLAACTADTFVGPDSASDASSNDGGGDGSVTCQTAPPCPTNAQCNTFDDGQQMLAPFGNGSANGGNLAFESDPVVSCPSALAAFVPQSAGDARAVLGGTAQITAVAVAHAKLELDVVFPKTVTGGATFLYLFANSDVGHGVGLNWSSGNWKVRDALTGDETGIDPRVGAWNHVVLDVVFASSASVGKVTFSYIDSSDKPQIATFTKSTLNAAAATVTQLTFSAGITPFAPTSAPMTMNMDDVAFSPF